MNTCRYNDDMEVTRKSSTTSILIADVTDVGIRLFLPT